MKKMTLSLAILLSLGLAGCANEDIYEVVMYIVAHKLNQLVQSVMVSSNQSVRLKFKAITKV